MIATEAVAPAPTTTLPKSTEEGAIPRETKFEDDVI